MHTDQTACSSQLSMSHFFVVPAGSFLDESQRGYLRLLTVYFSFRQLIFPLVSSLNIFGIIPGRKI